MILGRSTEGASMFQSQSTNGIQGHYESSNSQMVAATTRPFLTPSKISSKHGGHIRQAVSRLEIQLRSIVQVDEISSLFESRWLQKRTEVRRDRFQLIAWHIATCWIVGFACKRLSKSSGVRDALQWFLGPWMSEEIDDLVHRLHLEPIEESLRLAGSPEELFELLPYVLDPHELGSRLSVRQMPDTLTHRATKKGQGVFYTPSDVAHYMVHQVEPSIGANVLDPCCGTGIFLRTYLRELTKTSQGVDIRLAASSNLYGIDIDPWAVSAAAFVILGECLKEKDISNPLIFWHRLKMNFVCMDALTLDLNGVSTAAVFDEHIRNKDLLERGSLPRIRESVSDDRSLSIANALPDLGRRLDICLLNPPYRKAKCSELPTIQYETLQGVPNPDLYPAFVELCLKLLRSNESRMAIVSPLSFGANTGRQYRALRRLVRQTGGTWRFAFFDREPHALFGEEAKTRNTIAIFRQISGQSTTVIFSGPLQKWRSGDRQKMFNQISYTRISNDILTLIPKVDGDAQRKALHILNDVKKLSHYVQRIDRCQLVDACCSDDRTVFVGSTAYNFLNVFLRPPTRFPDCVPVSENALHALRCATAQDANVIFGLLSSRLAFWWWHVHSDGFHVTKGLLQGIPVAASLFNSSFESISKECWSRINCRPIVSVNKGRTSLGFCCSDPAIQHKLDAAVLCGYELDESFAYDLEKHHARVSLPRLEDNASSRKSAA